MPGEFAAVLLSTSPPLFGTSPRLAFVVPDVTKSYLARLTGQYASEDGRTNTSDQAQAQAGLNGLLPILNGRTCFSDTDVQRANSFIQADGQSIIQRATLNRSEPELSSSSSSQFTSVSAENSTDQQDQSDEYVSITVRRVSIEQNQSNESNQPSSSSADQIQMFSVEVDVSTPSPKPAPEVEATVAKPEIQIAADVPARKPNKKGRFVRFADELGKDLRMERVIEEEDELPLDDSFSEHQFTGQSDTLAFSSPLILEFAQPVSDYAQFREKLERLNVSLENVLAVGYRVSGTIRVRNLAFEKQVFVRITSDNWWSHTDFHATYVSSAAPSMSSAPNWSAAFSSFDGLQSVSNSNSNGSGSNYYDSFTFDLGDLSNKLTLHTSSAAPWPSDQQKIEMAICYNCGSQTFWDNNNGRNYTIVYVPPSSSSSLNAANDADRRRKSPYTNSFHPDFSAFKDSFSEFTAWTHYDSYNPYY